MSGKVQVEFDDVQNRCIESLATALDLTSPEVARLLAALCVELSNVITRLPPEKLDDFRRSLETLAASSSADRSMTLSELFRQANFAGERPRIEAVGSEEVDDEVLTSASERLMNRKAELYRRLAT